MACVRDATDASAGLLSLASQYGDQVRIEQMNVTVEEEAAQLAAKLENE